LPLSFGGVRAELRDSKLALSNPNQRGANSWLYKKDECCSLWART